MTTRRWNGIGRPTRAPLPCSHVQYLAPNRQDRLEHAVPGHFRAAPGGIPLLCNNIYNSEGGTHLTGFKTMFTNVINTYARNLGILKEKDANFTGADVRNGMTAVVSIKHPDPRFEGQTKTKLDNQDAAKVVSKVTGEEIVHFFDRNLETLKNVISCARQMRAALGIVDIVAEPQHILMELIDVLKSHLNGNPLALPAEIDDVMHRLLGLVHVLHKARDPVRLMERRRLYL